jgi:hypothetical protein
MSQSVMRVSRKPGNNRKSGQKGKRDSKQTLTYPNMLNKVVRDVNYIRKLINVEEKYIDSTATINPSSTASLVLLNGMATGTSAITRNGQSIKSVSLSGSFIMSINQSANTTFVRTTIVVDTQSNGAVFAASDLFVVPASVLSQYVVGYEQRFHTLFDNVSTVSLGGPESCIKPVVCMNTCNFHVSYNLGTAGTVADIAKNSLYLIVSSDQTTNTPAYSYSLRYLFVDN